MLDFDNNELLDKFFQNLYNLTKSMPALQHLSISNNDVLDNGMKIFSKINIPSLTDLQMDDTFITNKGKMAIEAKMSLRSIADI
jgi:hypothetical protein